MHPHAVLPVATLGVLISFWLIINPVPIGMLQVAHDTGREVSCFTYCTGHVAILVVVLLCVCTFCSQV